MLPIIIIFENRPVDMTENFEMSHQESIAQTEPNLSELKKEVEITPSTLKEITNREEFIERVIELNNNAKESINIQRSKQALVYLTEAEKILQYAASYGKTIDKYIIISVLHNEACCYQKIWQLQKCSNYLEALIFNFNSFVKTADQNNSSDESSSGRSGRDIGRKLQENRVADSLDRKTFLAKYYLQFCAVNSQTQNHSGALIAGRKSIQIMKNIFKELAEIAPTLKKMTYEKKSQFQYKIKLIEMSSRINDSVNINLYDSIFQAAKFYLRQWTNLKDGKDRNDRNYILEEQFKNYSIGNAMQIVPMTYKEFQERDSKNYTAKILLEKVLLLALGYFTISTQLRLIAAKKMSKKQDQNQKGNSPEFKQSQIYHLLSIIIAATCIPFQILYMKHVLSSYNNHYGKDLLTDNESDSKLRDSKFQDLIFPFTATLQIKNTTNNSFTGSIQDTLSKLDKQESKQQVNSIETVYDKKRQQSIKEDETLKNDIKKIKIIKNKSKSKSKNMKSMTFLGTIQRSEKMSPMPKSPNTHLKSPLPKHNLIKVKTSYKLKMSTEKIVTTTNNIMKDDKSRKKRQVRAQNIEFDYFMGRSKDLKKIKKTIQNGLNLASPRATGGSKSSSKRESPIPKYFEQLKPNSPTIKNLKSPKKSAGTTKLTKTNYHQYYL